MTSPPILLPFTGVGGAAPPLAGVRVVDFTRVLAGPFATQILGDLGADVIKIEHPVGGDDTRAIGPEEALGGETPFFLSMNRSKRSVAVDLKSEAGRHVALDLIATADVLVENFSGSVMRRFGLDYHALRDRFPQLIHCSISGYGRSGRNADAAGYDAPLSAEAGNVALNSYIGEAAMLGGLPYTDITTALNATIAILAALQARARDGVGQQVDVAMFDSALANLSFRGAEFLATGREPRLGEAQIALPRGRFETADGAIVITCAGDKMFRALCLYVVERPAWLEEARYATTAVRMRNGAAFLADVGAIFRSKPSAEWSARCKRAGIPCGAVRSPGEALMSEEASERGLVFSLPHPAAGKAPGIAQPFRFSETPCRYEAPPLLGEHTRAVLSELPGYDDAHLVALEAGGAIASLPDREEAK